MALNQRVVSSHFPYLPLQLEIRQELHELARIRESP